MTALLTQNRLANGIGRPAACLLLRRERKSLRSLGMLQQCQDLTF
jgi:hypothetical protein